MAETASKREKLRNEVVALVKDFINREGGITQRDLTLLFGVDNYSANSVISTLAGLMLKLS